MNTFRRPLSSFTEGCARCKRPIFREKLPIMGLLRTFTPVPGSVEEAGRSWDIGRAHGLPVSITETMIGGDIEFEIKEGEKDAELCFRCLVAFGGLCTLKPHPQPILVQVNDFWFRLGVMVQSPFGVFMEGLTEEETELYDGVDEIAEMLRKGR